MNKKWILRCLFFCYAAFLTYLLFFSEKYGRTGTYTEFNMNLVPFKEIRRFLFHVKELGIMPVLINIGGNIAAFMPFGFLLPYVSDMKHGFLKIGLTGFLASCIVEIAQLIGRVGVCDIDDVILNTVGTLAGYACYRLLHTIKVLN